MSRLRRVRRTGLLLAVTALTLLLTLLATPLLRTPAVGASSARILQTRILGKTVDGRLIVARRIGQPKSTRKVVFMAAMHGNETGPVKLLVDLRDGRQIYNADVWIITHVNPDGVAHHTRQNAHKVDLNRNFPRHWVHLYGTHYSGPAPASEPETKAIMRFLDEIRPRYLVSFHQPLYGVGRSGYARGDAFERRLSRGLDLPRKWFNCDGVCHGTLTDWYNHHSGGIAITVEYGDHVTDRQAHRGANGLLASVWAHR